jgi:hypothetical protein
MSKMKDSMMTKYDKFHNDYINKSLSKTNSKPPRVNQAVSEWAATLKKKGNSPVSKVPERKKEGTWHKEWSEKDKSDHQTKIGRAWND